MGTDSNYYKEIINRLENLTKKQYAYFASLGIQTAILAGISLFTLFTFLEMLFYFSSTVRTVLMFLFFVVIIGALGYLFLLPLLKYFNLFRKTDYQETAGRVGNSFPNVKDDLLNAMQLVSYENKNKLYSSSLINAAFLQVYNKTKSIKFESIVSFKKVKDLLLYFSGVIITAFVLLFFVPGTSCCFRETNTIQ